MNKEQQLRDKAYDIWQSEGCPDGRAEHHWALAESELIGMSGSAPNGKSTAARKTSTATRTTVRTIRKA